MQPVEKQAQESIKEPDSADKAKVQKDPRAPQAQQTQGQGINLAIKESKDPEVLKIKEEIDAVKKERITSIIKIKETRRRLAYKEAESVAIAKLLSMGSEEEKKAQRKKIGYLKKLKNRLEFKISTEATSLAAEKDLVRKIQEVNKDLNEAYKTVRLERKAEFIKNDIQEYKTLLADLDKQVLEKDKKLDELYNRLRKLLNIEGHQRQKAKKKPAPMPAQEINLEDIAVIKKKDKKVRADEE